MTVYSFSCSLPDNWSDLHFLIKTFGPGLLASFVATVSAFIAWLVYNVAKTQKIIAKNKYKMDMFDKRYTVFETIYEVYELIKKYDIERISNNNFDVDYDGAQKLVKLYLNDIKKINKFDFEKILLIKKEIIKSIRLNKNITKENVEFLFITINKFKEIKEKDFFDYPRNIRLSNSSDELEWVFLSALQKGSKKIFEDKLNTNRDKMKKATNQKSRDDCEILEKNLISNYKQQSEIFNNFLSILDESFKDMKNIKDNFESIYIFMDKEVTLPQDPDKE